MIRLAVSRILAALALLGASMLCSAAEAQRPNILILLADDLGFSDISPFGSEIPTPHLEALAKEGVVMTAMYATPMPHTTHAEFLFGVDHHLTVDRFSVPGSTPATALSSTSGPQPLSIATVLRDAGYHTYMIGTWDSGSDGEATPKAQGFESSHALLSMAGDYFPPDGANVPSAKESFRYLEDDAAVAPPAGYITDVWTDKLIAYLISDTSINAFDGADPANAEYLAAVRAGKATEASALRARHPSRWKLYRVDTDRGEINDLAAVHPQVLERLVGSYRSELERMARP